MRNLRRFSEYSWQRLTPDDLPMDNDTQDKKKDQVDNFQIQKRIKEECQKKYHCVTTLQYRYALLVISNDLYVS